MTETTHPQAPETPGVPPKPKARARNWLLYGSLALNLLVAGLAVGAWVKGPPGMRDGRDLGFGMFDEAFRPEDRMALRDAVRARAGDLRAARGQMAGDLAAVAAALRAEPFDATALKAALATQQEHLTARLRIGSEVIGDYLAGLSPKDRAAFAERLEARAKRGGQGKD
ncbi:periplasmic heavy metal sensor [Stagnihabitans tardus]|uniref:Periplasmic heavy metal sensor n=1 Tax=Stagnihabitans tardus TaxID=2699202 RepID=A0AAE4YDM7_9RHOB|nr:periplasmic heavy metal sensor [Stagnihabitans tardus]NBZ87690.1 periplasmic heavy metal sensor [Stagnihabitans tardus]